MKVLVATPLYPPDAGGPATYAKLLETEFPKRGIDVDIVNFGSVRRLPKGVRHAIYLVKLLRRGVRADIIFALDPVSVGYPASIAARLLRKPLMLKIVGDYAWEQGVQRFGVEDLLDEFIKKTYGAPVERLRRVQTLVARRAEKIIVPSEYLKKIVMRWGVPPEKIEVIYNAVDIPDDLPSKEKAREMFEVDPDTFLVLSAGRNVPWKGFELLRDVIGEIQKEYANVRLEIFHTLPHRELLTWIRSADIFVLNSGYEGFPHLVLEAMAAGTPVIASRAGGNPEVVHDPSAGSGQAPSAGSGQGNGILIEYNNREGLKAAILKLYYDLALRSRLAEAGARTAQRFSKEVMIIETIKTLTFNPNL